MQFVHQPLTWGFLLALLPLLIHLINLMRRRRVPWAAMEFLLQSYKKHRKWIWLKQLLLLLTRMAAIALLVAMLAQWVSRGQWLAMFGGSATHHYVLLDDSYSMSERTGHGTAFDVAKQTLGQIASQAMTRETQQKFTLIRFSRAEATPLEGVADQTIDRIADLNAEAVDAKFDLLLEERRRQMDVTQLAVGPRAAVELVNQLLEQGSDENNLVYLLSDFRAGQWASPAELRQTLKEAARHSQAIHFVRCVNKQQANLAITDLRPGSETRAAGVPLFVHASVQNFGAEPARRVPVQVRTTYFDPQTAMSSEPGKLQGKTDEPAAVLIDNIAPGETVTRRVQVFFPQAGAHLVEAVLPEDPVAIDNHRWCVLDLPEGEPVLIVDGSPDQRHARYLEAAFAPGQRVKSGIRPETQPASFLRDAAPETLDAYRSIYLLDVDRLDERSVESLESYVRQGGGLAVFVGERVNFRFYTDRFHQNGEGLFPLPLDRDDLLPAETFDNTPDFEVVDHPIFSVFLSERNPFIRLVTVERYLRPPAGWQPDPNSTVAVIARLRNGWPLAVERQFGQGRVIAFLTTVAPDWNNWAQDPSFVVVLLKLQAYLSSSARPVPTRLVGTPLDLELDTRKYRQEVAFVKPGVQRGRPVVVDRTATKLDVDTNSAVARLGDTQGESVFGDDTYRSGVYEAWATTMEGSYDVDRSAFNVDSAEGNLALSTSPSLVASLEPVKVVVRDADEYAVDATEQDGFNRGLLIMIVVVVLLLGEQLLAYAASFHPTQVLAQ